MTVELKRAQIRIPFRSSEGGPDQVTVWVTGANGSLYDFQVEVPRGKSREYLKGLGFVTALEIRTEEKDDPKRLGRKKRTELADEVTL